MTKKNEIKLYNVLFPLWMLMLFPMMWIAVLVGNFIIDSAVLLLVLWALEYSDKKVFYKKHILMAYGFGMLSDIIASLYMLLMVVVLHLGVMGDEWYITVPALIMALLLIFIFNYFLTFKKDEIKTRVIMSAVFAIVTAPYTFLIPSSWLY